MLFHGGGPPPTGVTTFTHGIIYYCARYESLPHAVATVRRTDLFRIVAHCYRVFFSVSYYVLSTSSIGHRSTSYQKRYSSSIIVAIVVYYRRDRRLLPSSQFKIVAISQGLILSVSKSPY